MPIIGAIGNASEYAYRSNLVSSPDPFDFIDLFDVDPGLTYYSDYVKITGIKSQLRVTIEPGASYSLFASVFDNQNVNSLAFDNDFPLQANFSQDLDPSLRFTTDSTFIRNNQSIRLSRTIPSPIFPPASFDSNLITFDQLNPRLSQSVLPTDIIPDVFGSTYTSVVSIGTSVQDWIIQVRDVDSVPDPIIIPSSLDVLAGVGVTTLSYTITGLEPNIKFSASIVDGNGGIIIDGITPSVTNALIGNGDIINLDTISSDYGQTKPINFGVGTYSTTWNVTTQPLDLSATFTFFKQNVVTGVFETTGISNFTPLTNRAISTLYNTTGAYPANRAEAFVINGLNVGLATDITFTSGASYEVRRPSGGTLIKGYDDPPIQIINGDAIRVRLTSSSTYSTAVTTTATVGTTSQQVWSITTQADPAPPPVVPPPVVPPPVVPPPVVPPPPTPTVTYPLTVEVFYVGGGGGGGYASSDAGTAPGGAGGGGGGGGAGSAVAFTLTGPGSNRTISATVGGGGAGSSSPSQRGGNGQTTTVTVSGVALPFTAVGGGGGGTGSLLFIGPVAAAGGNCVTDNQSGGGGGGGGPNNLNSGVGGCISLRGGNGAHNPAGFGLGGGGGGDSGAGGSLVNGATAGGTGGPGRGGLQFFGTALASLSLTSGFAGGGGGGAANQGASGAPGQNGGGSGATNLVNATGGAAFTGGGGGGGVSRALVGTTPGSNRFGASGGQGIVVVRYPAPNGARAATSTNTGTNTITYGTSNNGGTTPTINYAYHVFTGAATLTFN